MALLWCKGATPWPYIIKMEELLMCSKIMGDVFDKEHVK